MPNRMKEGGRSVYRIAVLAEQEAERQRYAEQIIRFCEAKGLFPQVMQYDDQERFLKRRRKMLQPMPSLHFPGWQGWMRRSTFVLCIQNVESFGAVTLIFRFMRSGCG